MKAAKTPIKSWNSGLGWDSQEALTFIEIRINSLPNIQPKRILASFLPGKIPGPFWTKENGGRILCVYIFLDSTWQECFTDPTAQATWQPVVSWLIFCDNPLTAFHVNGKNKGFWRFCTKNLHSLLQRQCRKQGMLSKSASANLRSAWWMAWRDSLFSSHMVIHRVFGKNTPFIWSKWASRVHSPHQNDNNVTKLFLSWIVNSIFQYYIMNCQFYFSVRLDDCALSTLKKLATFFWGHNWRFLIPSIEQRQ